MTSVSQKCQYALRALFELCKRRGTGPTPVGQVAEAQSIPVRFLEVILGQLKQHGLVQSRRGVQGGYLVSREPSEILVGQVVRVVDGPLDPVDCLSESGCGSTGNGSAKPCGYDGLCAFRQMWEEARDAISGVYDQTSFQDLLDREARLRREYIDNYQI
ncbi:MAG: RrF2 family transcriptional regulator [Phycisphaerae bacterium]